MTRTIPKTCDCCGIKFMAGSPITRWCNDRCAMRAYYRRRRGQPEADPAWTARAKAAQAQVMQPQLLPTPAPQVPTRAMVELEVESRDWQGTPIQRRQSDGWVNATAMCQAGGKRWNHYVANDRTRDYISALQQALPPAIPCAPVVAGNPADPYGRWAGIPADPFIGSPQEPATVVIRSIGTGPNDLRGTWIHPRLAIDLARWISPAFAVWMDGWFLETITGRATAAPTVTPAAPGITITARTEREAWGIWQAAIEGEALGAIRMQLGVKGLSDHAVRMHHSAARWRFAAC